MNEARFWELIEKSWETVGGLHNERKRLAEGKLSEEGAEALADNVDDMVAALRDELEVLEKDELLQFDRILERKLFDIDRAEIQAETDGSDDGFLYSRGFIVAIGKTYYEAVKSNPKRAIMDAECEDMCYLSFHAYEDRFGEMPSSEISRESCSNKVGWPDAARD